MRRSARASRSSASRRVAAGRAPGRHCPVSCARTVTEQVRGHALEPRLLRTPAKHQVERPIAHSAVASNPQCLRQCGSAVPGADAQVAIERPRTLDAERHQTRLRALPTTCRTLLSRSTSSTWRYASSLRRTPQSNNRRRMARSRRSSKRLPLQTLNSHATSTSDNNNHARHGRLRDLALADKPVEECFESAVPRRRGRRLTVFEHVGQEFFHVLAGNVCDCYHVVVNSELA
jgi:hypothetical protein